MAIEGLQKCIIAMHASAILQSHPTQNRSLVNLFNLFPQNILHSFAQSFLQFGMGTA
jgi:hypothetical protein